MALPRFARNVALVVARLVAQNDLFEKPGERPRTAPLPPPGGLAAKAGLSPLSAGSRVPSSAAGSPPAAVSPAPVGASAPAAAKAPRGKAKNVALPALNPPRPVTGCHPVDLDGLHRALKPSGKPLVVNHWASWCDPCVDELPRLVRAAAGVADIGEFVGVSWDLFDHPGDPVVVAKKVATFADSVGVGYGSVLFVGEPKELFTALGLDSELIPQTVVLAPDGTVVWKKNGVLEHDDVFPLIRAVKQAAGVA